MNKKLIVTIKDAADRQSVENSGCEVVAEYPDTVLVACEPAQEASLVDQGLEVAEAAAPAPAPAVGAAMSANILAAAPATAAAEPTLEPGERGSYILTLVGPATGAWLDEVEGSGAEITGRLPGFRLIVRAAQDAIDVLGAQPWVEAASRYPAAMKIGRTLSAQLEAPVAPLMNLMAAAPLAEPPALSLQVEVLLFEGEDVEEIADEIASDGGVVIQSGGDKVVAFAVPSTVQRLASLSKVKAIMPHEFPHQHNDVARRVMNVPADPGPATEALRGADQIIAVADTGLDTGNQTNIHADFAGRITQIVSLPAAFSALTMSTFTHDAPPFDDGAADQSSGHGTHVAGSALGNGAAAEQVNANNGTDQPVPKGAAPEAAVFFQAIEQAIQWKSAAELQAQGTLVPLDWPPAKFSLYGIPDNLTQLFDQAYAAGARIHTNSWGSSAAAMHGVYNGNAQELDRYMWNHRDIVILFSAGNDGVDTQAPLGSIDNDSVGPPATAKNCVAVGASENERPAGSVPTPGLDRNWNELVRWPNMGGAGHVSDNPDGMAAFSSRGPTDDGRIKPDVVAPGTNVLSARSSVGTGELWGTLGDAHPLESLYLWSGGTSMSCPLVAGFMALIREHLTKQRGHDEPGVKPSGALLKAALVNGARRITGHAATPIPAGANNVSGFGLVDYARTFRTVDSPFHFDDEPAHAVESGQMRRYEVAATNLQEPLKVTLVWTDFPAQPGAPGGTLGNRLYLQVVEPGGNVLDGDTQAFPNVLNNVQQVFVENPIEGPYEIRVRGVDVVKDAPGAMSEPGSNPRQDFALVATNVEALELI